MPNYRTSWESKQTNSRGKWFEAFANVIFQSSSSQEKS